MKLKAPLLLGTVALLVLASSAMGAGRLLFQSPSGNIRCMIAKPFGTPTAACVTMSPKRAGDVPDGEKARVGRSSRVGFIRQGFKLDYGRSVRRFGFRCTSRFRGVTCSDLGSGRGFTICREGANTFPGGRPTPCRATQPAPGTAPPATPTPPPSAVTPAPTTPPRQRCNPNYAPCVPNSPIDLDCSDIGFPVQVIGSDPYGLDGDGDGIGCESS
jgi:hypothetical protein